MRNDYFDSNSCTGGACAPSESSRSRAPAAIGVVHRGARKVGFGEICFSVYGGFCLNDDVVCPSTVHDIVTC